MREYGKIYNAKFMEQNSCKKTTRRGEIEKAAFSTSGIIEQEDWFIKGAEWADEHPCCNQLEKQGQVKESSIPQHENKTCASEDDERIRKALIRFHKSSIDIDGIKGEDIIAWLEKQGESQDKGEISDGYHTFNELYYYRMLYNAAFFNLLPKEWVHKSKRHHDGEECFGGGWFIVMANLPTGQISNHYELKYWKLFHIPEKDVADEWDGHTPKEAAERLHKYLLEKQGEQKSDDNVETTIQNFSVLADGIDTRSPA